MVAGVSPSADIRKNQQLNFVALAFCYLDNAAIPVNFFNYIKELYSTGIIAAGFNISPVQDDRKPEALASAFFESKEIFIYPKFFKVTDEYYDYKRAATLIHEARHLEINTRNKNPQYSFLTNDHVTCTRGILKGNNCDPQFTRLLEDASPFSYEVFFYRYLFDSSQYNVDRKELALWIIYTLKNNFNYVSTVDFRDYTSGFDKYLSGNDLTYSQQ